jgi:hypothetical protein
MILFVCIMLGTFLELTIWFYAALAAVSFVMVEATP